MNCMGIYSIRFCTKVSGHYAQWKGHCLHEDFSRFAFAQGLTTILHAYEMGR